MYFFTVLDMNEKRPLDALNRAKGKKVYVLLKNGKEIVGELQALDIHINLWLENAEVSTEDKTMKLGTVLVRGDSIIYASIVE